MNSLGNTCRTSIRLRKNQFGTAELQWPARLGQQEYTTQDNRARHARLAGKARHAELELCASRLSR
jgi:hypothetical protein